MKNEYLRHTLATIKYRFQKSIKYRNPEFGDFTLGKGSRTTKEIVHHMFAVMNATTTFILEERMSKELPEKLDLEAEIDRFNLGIQDLDAALAKNELSINYAKRLLQGPLSDILTHIGQISMLSRLNNHPIEGEDFSSASIRIEENTN